MKTSSIGIGQIVLAPLAGEITLAQAGVSDGASVNYLIEYGQLFERGVGKYTSSGLKLDRLSVIESNAGDRINLTREARVSFLSISVDQVYVDGSFKLMVDTGSAFEEITSSAPPQ